MPTRTIVLEVNRTPDGLRPYIFHGLDPHHRSGAKDAMCECPWCNRPDRFNIVLATGIWRCPACQEGNEAGGGNARTFIRILHQKSMETTEERDYEELRKDRKLLHTDTLRKWGLCKSIITGNWLLPGRRNTGEVDQLYQYVYHGERMAFLPTPTLGHAPCSTLPWNTGKRFKYVCEGVWDGMALWEAMAEAKDDGNGLIWTGNPESSLLAEADVIVVPTASVFYPEWSYLFEGKVVLLMGQNDHEKVSCTSCNRTYSQHDSPACPKCQSVEIKKSKTAPASYEGMKRIVGMLTAAKSQPEDIQLLHWGALGYDTQLKTGFDIRDAITR